MRVCFDLDETLVSKPMVVNDYSTVLPIQENIELLKNIKNNGHTIIIYTARKMETFKGNIGKVVAEIALTTINTLTQFEIPYDELYFGKPSADYYVDDKSINLKQIIDINKLKEIS